MQAKINIEKGKIKSIKPNEDGVELIINGHSKSYPRSFIFPGFVDSHGHIAALGSSVNGLRLNNAKSAEECIRLANKTQNTKADWITGRGWNQEKWYDNKLPDASILDDSFSDTPVFLVRVDGHCAWVNSEALKRAKIDKYSKTLVGGQIQKDKSGKPTGLLFDNAIDLVKNIIPKYSHEQIKTNIKSALSILAQQGITEVDDMDVNPSLIPIFKELASHKQLPIRINSYISGHKNEWLNHKELPYKSEYFNISGIKLYADGSLGSRTAAMHRPYADDKNNKGLFLINNEDLFDRVKLAIEHGFNVATHAIGDAANRMVLKIYTDLFEKRIVNKNSILRVEHAQHILPEDLKYFSQYPIISSVQPIHCISDVGTITEKRIGDRINYAYPWKSIINSGGILIAGSDFPIEDFRVLNGIDAFVNRKPNNSDTTWFSDETLSLEEALNAYTKNPNLIQNNNRGKIEFNNDADLVILNKDIEKINKEQIKNIKVIATIVNGQIIYSATNQEN